MAPRGCWAASPSPSLRNHHPPGRVGRPLRRQLSGWGVGALRLHRLRRPQSLVQRIGTLREGEDGSKRQSAQVASHGEEDLPLSGAFSPDSSLCPVLRYTLTEGDFHHLKKARLTHLHLPPAPCDLKILTIMECDSAASSTNNISEATPPNLPVTIYQVGCHQASSRHHASLTLPGSCLSPVRDGSWTGPGRASAGGCQETRATLRSLTRGLDRLP